MSHHGQDKTDPVLSSGGGVLTHPRKSTPNKEITMADRYFLSNPGENDLEHPALFNPEEYRRLLAAIRRGHNGAVDAERFTTCLVALEHLRVGELALHRVLTGEVDVCGVHETEGLQFQTRPRTRPHD
jgi:hypothetical protein